MMDEDSFKILGVICLVFAFANLVGHFLPWAWWMSIIGSQILGGGMLVGLAYGVVKWDDYQNRKMQERATRKNDNYR